ncbi:HEAT repeat domain-containing protein [Rhodococcus tukisamuensis]|uniref:HEAT repeat-containing protein n=1 Tax=Rhodococcus tukisamuensis TaxID=168276 RepID=A0A1G7DEX3_9NOCA|nr:HEAT repeat domain-containing protein [Rhodococcus tukisamuensis]SDE50071.1 hypothetical protein SAMN05444580_11918 [Rhodococcus tukisamuensis]
MAKGIEELRSQLGAIEPDEDMYADLGPSDVPLLETLLDDDEAWMATRAVYALTRIGTPQALEVLQGVAAHERGEVRVALAVVAGRRIPAATADPILTRLLDDGDVGVRKFAIKSVSDEHGQEVKDRLAAISASDDVLRGLARSQVEHMGN